MYNVRFQQGHLDMKSSECFPIVTAMLLTAVLNLVQSERFQEICQKKLYVDSGETKNFSHSAFATAFSQHDLTFCKYEIDTKPGNLIRLQIKNSIQLMAGVYQDEDCLENYIHVGNDPRRVGVEMLTSYKLCRTTKEQEIVSRGNYVWLIVRSLEPSVFSWLHIHYQSRPKVLCKDTAFQCSPVQCVPKTAICNGVHDCDNGRDEYCDSGFQEKTTASETEPCFMCRDGSCINPVLPRYSLDWGKQLWYLCDDYAHCPDGTDERKDVCYRIKGRASALFQCTPKDRNLTAHLWDTVLCDGQQDCEGGEDESHDLCTPTTDIKIHFEPVSIILPLAAIAMVILGGLAGRALYHIQDRRISLPTSCMDTTYIFTEFSNTPTTIEEGVDKDQLKMADETRQQVNTNDTADLDFDDDLDDEDLDLDDFDNEEATFTVVTTPKQTTV